MGYGLTYMGSKSDICASIAINFPKADNFYDLFGGGFSMSDFMLRHKSHLYKHFHYNELRTPIVELVQKAIRGEFNYDKFKPAWVTREEFHAKKEVDAYIALCWSFGNNSTTYLFSEQIEAYKRSMHQVVVFNEFDSTAIKVLGIKEWPIEVKTIKQKRLYLRRKIEWYRVNNRLPKVLWKFLPAKQVVQLDQLKQLQRLQQLQQLNFYNLSYEQVPIQENSIVYCDIPYKVTQDNDKRLFYKTHFCHKTFFNWAASRDFPVYISEYNIEDSRFKLVYSINKTVKMSSKGMTSESGGAVEKLYWNGVKN